MDGLGLIGIAAVLCVLQAESYTVDAVLSSILHLRVADHTQQLALMGALDLLLQQHTQVGGDRRGEEGGGAEGGGGGEEEGGGGGEGGG